MANTLLTDDIITKEALMILSQKMTFGSSINRGYDAKFAKSGAKIGDTVSIRLPNQYLVTESATLDVQDTVESSVDLTLNKRAQVSINFDSEALTLDIDKFADRYLKPAVSAIAQKIESNLIGMTQDVYQMSNQDGTAITLLSAMKAQNILNDALAPMENRNLLLQNNRVPAVIDNIKGLFQDSSEIKKAYREGIMGRSVGFDWAQSSLVTPHTTGTAVATTGYLINGADQTGSEITCDTGSGTTLLKGDIVTLAGCYRVHPVTKTTTSELQQFVVTEDAAAAFTTLKISPSIVVSGAKQNVSASPTDSGAILKIAAPTAGLTLDGSLAYHKDAFAFATADLVMPTGVDFASRQVLDGISMRIVRQYDINNDAFPCRIDVLYGYKTVRPELACRLHADG